MKRFNTALSLLLAVGATTLAGCVDTQVHLDPLAVNGRDGSDAKPVSYATMMRIGAAAHAGGDLPTAVSIYRRAAAVHPASAAPLVAAANTLAEMGKNNEAITTYMAALSRSPTDPEALRGLARAYLRTGKPELAGRPLAIAYKATPNDPKLLQLIGVADDFAGQHEEAQARYRRGLELAPHDRGLALDLALSLAITGDYAEAVRTLRPVAMALTATPRERQTLALIYGLAGNRSAAARMARLDLEPDAVAHNLAFYDTLRRLSPQARARAIESLTTHKGTSEAAAS